MSLVEQVAAPGEPAPMYEYVVLPERGQRAIATFVGATRPNERGEREMNEEQLIDLMFDLGWDHLVSYNEDGTLNLSLTDLQFVGLAAALAALREAKWAKRIRVD